MRGEISSGTFAKRHPLDWYVEEQWVTELLFFALGQFEREREAGEAIWDPSCGTGNSCAFFVDGGFRCFLSDVVDNVDWPGFYDEDAAKRCRLTRPEFFSADFLELDRAPAPCSIVCNPPYSYRKGIAEAFTRQALKLTSRRVCMLVPSKWLASQARYRLFAVDRPPQAVLHLTQRPSMPPGDRIHLMGSRAFSGGMVDYCWIVWDVTRPTAPGETRTIWLPPLHAFDRTAKLEGLA